VGATLIRWITNMLSSRRARATLCGVVREVKTQRGCPQGGVLSPSLWNLVVDELLRILNEQGFYAQGYADDIVILIRGKHLVVCLELVQRALTIVEEWCSREGLTVNPAKTVMVPFTNKRIVLNENLPILLGQRVQVAKEFKYLGVRLDDKLSWNSHLASVTSRSQITMAMMKRALGRTWGLSPRMTHWVYTRVVRPMVVYGSIVWWPKTLQSTAAKSLSKVQRAACLGILGAMKGTPTAAMEVMLCLPPLDIFIKGEARLAAYRLQCGGEWRYHHASKHCQIVNILQADILDWISDKMTTMIDLDVPYSVKHFDREEWSRGEPTQMKRGITWYTDGSKMATGTGAGVYRAKPRVGFSKSLGKFATVFQSEIAALAECAWMNVEMGYTGKTIYMNSDSKAALMALANHSYTSKMAWDCHNVLKALAKTNTVTLVWVPGHMGVVGNEEADRCARAGAENDLIGPEPACGISYSMVRATVSQWVSEEHQRHWVNTDGQGQAKRLLGGPLRSVQADALGLKRKDLRKVAGFITGHWSFYGHLHRMGIHVESLLCRKCGGAEETAGHVLFDCPAVSLRRFKFLGLNREGDDIQYSIVRKILGFCKDLGFDGV
jgi:ribonuclease HI